MEPVTTVVRPIISIVSETAPRVVPKRVNTKVIRIANKNATDSVHLSKYAKKIKSDGYDFGRMFDEIFGHTPAYY